VTALAVLCSSARPGESPQQRWMAQFGATRRAVVSIGNFDGLHLGHQKIIRMVVARARASDAIAAVVTFDPHPVKVLRPAQAPMLVQTLAQRLEGFAALGLDAALVLGFDAVMASRSPEEFVHDVLVEPVRASAILVGPNFHFGHRQAGNVARLEELGRQFGFTVEIVDSVSVNGEVVSSTAVRNAIKEGHVASAARLLGRPFALTGPVRSGAGRGSTILFPTLNLAPEQELLPKTGVYATETLVAGKLYRSATNVGFRPTFNGTQLGVETHLFDFSERVTEGRLEVRLWKRLRDEQKFSGPDELRKQIAADLERARDFFRSLDPSSPQSPST
jgi:riboflavin kinase / FMN adenylyltransferase